MADLAEITKKVLTEEYIIYHLNHYRQIVPDKANEYLSPIWDRNRANLMSNMVLSQADAIVTSMRAKGNKVADPFEIAMALDQGRLLDELMSAVATGLNNSLTKNQGNVINQFSGVLEQAHSFDNLLDPKSGSVTEARLQSFFELIEKGINVLSQSGIDAQTVISLTGIGQKIMNNSTFTYQPTAQIVTSDQLKVAQKVVQYLDNAADVYRAQGRVSKESLRSTMTNIFSTALGETISQTMLTAALPDVDEEIAKVSEKVYGSSDKIKLVNTKFEPFGASKVNGKTVKVDVLNSNALKLTTTIQGASAQIDMATNVSVKWYKSQNKAGTVSHISLGQMKLESILYGGDFDIAPRGLAYNIIAHHWADKDSYQLLRSTIAATYLNEWISGSGGLEKTTNKVDKAQLLMINGKLYSMTDIVQAIVKRYYDTNNMAAYVSMKGIGREENAWQHAASDSHDDYMVAAEARSRKVQGIINNISVAMTLNIHSLDGYLT